MTDIVLNAMGIKYHSAIKYHFDSGAYRGASCVGQRTKFTQALLS